MFRTTVYSWEDDLRYVDSYETDSVKSAEQQIFWMKMQTDVAGYIIVDTEQNDRRVSEWWDRKSRKNWATRRAGVVRS